MSYLLSSSSRFSLHCKRLFALGVFTLASCAALAHDDAYLDSQKSQHGGQVRMAGIYHVELVLVKNSPDAKDNPVEVYVTDHAGNKVPTAGATGQITLLSGKVKSSAVLMADGDNHFKTSAKYASSPDLKVVLAISMAGAKLEQTRFTPFASKDGKAEHHH